MEQLVGIIEFETSDEVFEMPELHKVSIETGLAQIKEGKSLSYEEVVERVKLWTDK